MAFLKIGAMNDGASLQASESEARWVGDTAVVATLWFGNGVLDHDVWSPREPTVSGVLWNMVRHGSFAVPRIDEFSYLDEKRSYAPFFDQLRQSLDRLLYTTLLDDRRLPLIEFYLDRRVPIIQDNEKLFHLLESSAKVGVILDYRNYERLKKDLELIPHQFITPSSEIQRLVLVNTR